MYFQNSLIDKPIRIRYADRKRGVNHMDIETIEAIKALIAPINKKLDNLDLKVDTIMLNQKTSERAIRKDVQYLNDEVDTLIAVLEAKGILPKVVD